MTMGEYQHVANSANYQAPPHQSFEDMKRKYWKNCSVVPQFMVLTSVALCLMKTQSSGTLGTWEPFWICWRRSVELSSRVSTHPTSTLACGRPHLRGTRRTWTSTASTTCTLGSPKRGMQCPQSMANAWRGWPGSFSQAVPESAEHS